MNKEKIIEILKKYNFNEDNYLVISGAAMVLLGIKESTSDIDISVSKDYYDHLLNNYDCVFDITNEYGINCYFIDDIINFSTTYYDDNKIFIEDIPIQNPKDILKLKLSLNREKDKKDIKLLKEFMNQ